MKIEIWEKEYYPILVPQIARPKKRLGVYEVDDNIYRKWTKVFDDFHSVQTEIEKIVEKAERKRRRSICGFKLEERDDS